jgi:hypothetical protein
VASKLLEPDKKILVLSGVLKSLKNEVSIPKKSVLDVQETLIRSLDWNLNVPTAHDFMKAMQYSGMLVSLQHDSI